MSHTQDFHFTADEFREIEAQLRAPLTLVSGHALAAGSENYLSGIWPVWKNSRRGDYKFVPVDKTEVTRWFHLACSWNASRQAGPGRPRRYGGILGSAFIRVLQSLIFDFLDYKTGRLDPSYNAIAKKTGLGRSTVAVALKLGHRAGVIHWDRRCKLVPATTGRRQELRQETNAYTILSPHNWRGYKPAKKEKAPPPHPKTWGAVKEPPRIYKTLYGDVSSIDVEIALASTDPVERRHGERLSAVIQQYGYKPPD